MVNFLLNSYCVELPNIKHQKKMKFRWFFPIFIVVGFSAGPIQSDPDPDPLLRGLASLSRLRHIWAHSHSNSSRQGKSNLFGSFNPCSRGRCSTGVRTKDCPRRGCGSERETVERRIKNYFRWLEKKNSENGELELTPISSEAVKSRGKRADNGKKRPSPNDHNDNEYFVYDVPDFSDEELDFDEDLVIQKFRFPFCYGVNTEVPRDLTIRPSGYTKERGLRWQAGTSTTNTCNIDSFLTNFILRDYKRPHFTGTYVRLHESNRGEAALRHITQLNRDRDRDLTRLSDKLIKEAWIKIAMNRVISTRQQFDCMGDEAVNIFSHLASSSKLALIHTCGCQEDRRDTQTEELGLETRINPGQLLELSKHPFRPPGLKATRRSKKKCKECKNDFRFNQGVVGNCTWFLRFQPTDDSADPMAWPESVSFRNVENKGRLVSFKKEYASFSGPSDDSDIPVDETGPVPIDRLRVPLKQRPVEVKKTKLNPGPSTSQAQEATSLNSYHLVSFHFFDGKVFYYDGTMEDGHLKKVRSPIHYIRTKKLSPESIVYVREDDYNLLSYA